jgi:hypothetical protein
MAAIHVFAIDWVPAKTDIASGGGLRSLQIIEALREAGHKVSYSIPANCRKIRVLGRDHRQFRNIEIHDSNNQIDLLRKLQPEVVIWTPPLIRTIPFTGSGELVHVCDLLGLPHVEAAMGAPGLEKVQRERLVALCSGAGLVLTGSEEQHGYWLSELTRVGAEPATAVVPYALPASLIGRGVTGTSRLTRLHVTGMVYAWSTSVALLGRVAEWVARRRNMSLSIIVGTDPGGATDRSVLKELKAIAARRGTEMAGEVSFADAMADYRAGSLSLDIYEPNLERRMAVPIRTVNALAHGVPVLSTIDGTLTRRLRAEGAGIVATDQPEDSIEAALDRLAALPANGFANMARAARAFAKREYSAQAVSATLTAAVAEAIERHATARRSWGVHMPQETRQGHVLVISNVEPHHRELRVEVPLGALFGRQLISGYTIWSRGDFRFSTGSNVSDQIFDAIWVQREISPDVAIALATLGRPFVYDIDDNLLVSPSFRHPFSFEAMQTVRNLVVNSTILSCSTARLAQLLHSEAGTHLIGKAMVTPNLLREQPGPRVTGTPRFLVWVSSDTPALTDSRLSVIKAIRDFLLSFGLKLICLGSEPPDLLTESDIEIMHIRHIPYGSYLSTLRSLAPAILACPLETASDAATGDFIAGKSDVKLLEALASGLTGVFSRAPPYRDTDLPEPILCDNTYAGWFEGLRRAWETCERGGAAQAVPPERCANDIGVRPWLEAVRAVRLQRPLHCNEFRNALTLMRGRYGRRLLSEAEFEEDFYLTTYPDVQLAIQNMTVRNAYAHYLADGFGEGRLGRANDGVASHNEQVWANLMHTIGDLRTAVENRAQQVETLRARRATRIKLRRSVTT